MVSFFSSLLFSLPIAFSWFGFGLGFRFRFDLNSVRFVGEEGGGGERAWCPEKAKRTDGTHHDKTRESCRASGCGIPLQ